MTRVNRKQSNSRSHKDTGTCKCKIPLSFVQLQAKWSPSLQLVEIISLFLLWQIHPQIGDVWNSFLASLTAAQTEAAAADVWKVAIEKGVVKPEVATQQAGTLKGAAYYLWTTQGVQAVMGQQDQAAAHKELLDGLNKLLAQYLSLPAPQQGAQAATVPRKKNLPPPDSVPVRPLNEHFLSQHMVDEWLTHFDSVLSEYDATENEAKLVLLRKVQLPAAVELEELSLQQYLKGLCDELKQLAQRRADRAWWQFRKSPEQTFTLFLTFISDEAKRAGITQFQPDEIHACPYKFSTQMEIIRAETLEHINELLGCTSIVRITTGYSWETWNKHFPCNPCNKLWPQEKFDCKTEPAWCH